jgi:hypothetical protein
VTTSYYEDWNSGEASWGSTNYNLYANAVLNYGRMVIFGVATITQLLSIFGIAPEINAGVWLYLVGLGGGLVGLTYSIF